MKRFNVEQGSHEWLQLRLGVPTASNFDRILTPAKLKLSAQSRPYRERLLTEWLLGVVLDDKQSQFMERGTELEEDAVLRFELDHDCDVDRVGFCMDNEQTLGCSPDGLVGDDAGLEIKIYEAVHHVHEMLSPEPSDAHKGQIQGNLYVTGRKRWHRMYWHPSLPPVYRVFERDEAYLDALGLALDAFLDSLDEDKQRLIDLGCTPRLPRNPDAFCHHVGSDQRWCWKRQDVVETSEGWRCPEHAEPVLTGVTE